MVISQQDIRDSLVKLQDHIVQPHLKKLFIIESSLTDGLPPSPKDHDSKICSHLYNIHNIHNIYTVMHTYKIFKTKYVPP